MDTCATCKWLRPFDDLMMVRISRLIGSCRRFPKWEGVESDHYCGEHHPASANLTDEGRK